MTLLPCSVGKQKDVNTKPFREATWNYIHSIKGIRHDDYSYRKVGARRGNNASLACYFLIVFAQVNQVLDREYKTYIRMVGVV